MLEREREREIERESKEWVKCVPFEAKAIGGGKRMNTTHRVKKSEEQDDERMRK